MEVESGKRKWILVTLIILTLIGAFLYSYFKYGSQGISFVIGNMITILFWLLLIGVIGFILYFLFFYEKKINATEEVFKNISKESKVSCPDNLRNLYTAGDETHRSKKIGKIIGYSNRQNFKIMINKKEKNYQSEDCFLIKRTGNSVFKNLFLFFSKPILIRVPENMRDILQGDVKINCISLVKHGLYFYPNNIHLDFQTIDHTIYYEGERYVQIESISMLAPLVKKSIGIDYKDLIALEGKSGMDMIKDVMKGGAK